MTRCLCLLLVLAGCVPSHPPRGAAPAGGVVVEPVLRVEVAPEEAAAIRARTIYAGALMRYHAFVSDATTIEFWHDGEHLATINDQGVVAFRPVILSRRRSRVGRVV